MPSHVDDLVTKLIAIKQMKGLGEIGALSALIDLSNQNSTSVKQRRAFGLALMKLDIFPGKEFSYTLISPKKRKKVTIGRQANQLTKNFRD